MTQPAVEGTSRKQNRTVIVALFLLFVAPVMLAYVAHYMGWYTVASKNKGELLESPYAHFEDFSWFDASGEPLHFKDFETQVWWVYFPKTNECEAVCEANMRLLTQTHAGLGKDAEKVTRLVVFPSAIQYQDKIQKPEQLRLARANGNAVSLRDASESKAELQVGDIYLMDAHGNIFMRYESVKDETGAKVRSRDLREDVRRLIKTTGI